MKPEPLIGKLANCVDRVAVVVGALQHRIEIPATRAIMGPVAASRIGVETQCAGTALHIARGGSVGDQAVHIDVAVGKRQVDAGGIAMAGQEAAAPQIDAALKAAHPAAGTRIGKRFVAIVDPLSEEACPIGAGQAGALAAGVCKRQCVTDALV